MQSECSLNFVENVGCREGYMQPPPFYHHEQETGDKYLPLVMNQNEELLTVSNMHEL